MYKEVQGGVVVGGKTTEVLSALAERAKELCCTAPGAGTPERSGRQGGSRGTPLHSPSPAVLLPRSPVPERM